MSDVSRTAVLGAGVIGASWAALFLASGRSVTVYDPDPGAESAVRGYPTRRKSPSFGSGIQGAAALARVPDGALFFHISADDVQRGSSAGCGEVGRRPQHAFAIAPGDFGPDAPQATA